MIYILETNLSENKSVYFSLTNIFGIGQCQSFLICKNIGLSRNCKLPHLTTDQIVKLVKFAENSNLLINSKLKKEKIIFAKSILVLVFKKIALWAYTCNHIDIQY